MGKLLTVAEISERLNVRPGRIYELVHRREIPFVKLGWRQLRFDERSINAWLAERSFEPSGKGA